MYFAYGHFIANYPGGHSQTLHAILPDHLYNRLIEQGTIIIALTIVTSGYRLIIITTHSYIMFTTMVVGYSVIRIWINCIRRRLVQLHFDA